MMVKPFTLQENREITENYVVDIMSKHRCTDPRHLTVPWLHVTLMGPDHGTWLMTPTWHVEFTGNSNVFERFVHPCIKI
jgi:hypothetical protein